MIAEVSEKLQKNEVKSREVLGLRISSLSYQDVLVRIFNLATERFPSYVCFANAHMAIEAKQNQTIRNSVNNATIVTSDGMSVVMAMKYLHKVKQDRTAGMDMIYDIIQGAANHKLSVFLFGSSQQTLDIFIRKAKTDFPSLNIVGAISPPFQDIELMNNESYLKEIKASGAQLVLVSLGCPKQEQWMAKYSAQVPAVMLGIGGAFSLYANQVKRAPVFMQKYCLEWMYRLFQEPKRLWKRYLVTNTLFMYYFLKEWGSKLFTRY